MIGVVIKKGSDYSAFSHALTNKGYDYTVRFSRIFYIKCDMKDFTLNDYPDIESLETLADINITRMSVDVTDEVLLTKRSDNFFGAAGKVTTKRSWAPHRIIRRKNPFLKERDSILLDPTSRYKCARTGTGVDIYILDGGFNTSHMEYFSRVQFAGGRSNDNASIGDTDFIHNESYTTNHGSFCVSCAAGSYNGIARTSQIFYVGILGVGATTEDDYMGWFEVAYDHYMSRSDTNRPAVMSMSYGADKSLFPQSATAYAGYQTMLEAGLIMCIASGNSDWDLDNKHIVPAESHPDIVVVGATDCYDFPMLRGGPYGSAYRVAPGTGSAVDIYAPGQEVLCADPSGFTKYKLVTGTSFATPYTAGVIACMLQGYQRLTNINQVRAVIQKLKDNATTGALRFVDNAYFPNRVVHDRLLYLDPDLEIEEIYGLVKL